MNMIMNQKIMITRRITLEPSISGRQDPYSLMLLLDFYPSSTSSLNGCSNISPMKIIGDYRELHLLTFLMLRYISFHHFKKDTDDTETFKDYHSPEGKYLMDIGAIGPLWYDIKDGKKIYDRFAGVNPPMEDI